MKIARFEDIACWKDARNIVKHIYKLCNMSSFKKDFSLADQTKRSAISIMANIAEGFTRKSNREFIQYLFIAKSSAAELQSHLYIALDQKYLSTQEFQQLYTELDLVQRKISSFIKYLRTTLK
ncbi:MAG: four helix bundle protein [Candidatus Fischerbacteria bacterium RBG_13_37_8]|uniref:Four helix bundle protein n=1 Tax=Candidatus Fischerbacteria bacterium RBG_13_37_8 TaxID=1817863 RepID=A0A1F5VDM6_9BACT|nr:MAG: four helix bundle protein [Candidatus Fischerbacteria bacterium RBG_13_37_8]